MSIEELKQKFDAACTELSQDADTVVETHFFITAFMKMFGEYPNIISLDTEGFYLNPKGNEEADDEESDEYTEKEEEEVFVWDSVFCQQTMIALYEHFKDKAYVVRKEMYPVLVMDHQIIMFSAYSHNIFIMQSDSVLSEEIKQLVVDNKHDKDNRWFTFVTSTSHGFDETPMKAKKQEINIATNYNDDLPDNEIKDFLKGNQSGLILLHGEPGTGKTTYIRHLMYELKGRRFIVLDSSVFNYITDASFIQLLLENKNAVIILEDCESMLADRTTGNNKLSALLNLSDGIIGDSFNFKFICTFNANVTKLDKALLRRGRMKLKYEFKNLCPEKTQALGKQLGYDIPEGKSLSLADIFNYGVDNGNREEKKVGFGR